MHEQDEARFAEQYERYCTKLNALGVPMQVWKDVLVELYFPVDWRNTPDAFKELAQELEHPTMWPYDLTRAEGISDHDYARSLLMQAQQRRDERRAYVVEMMNPDFSPVPPDDEENDDEILEAYFTERDKEKSVN